MTQSWEDKFRDWAAPPGKVEEERCENAVRAVRNALAASAKLKGRGYSVILQGSYRNKTNTRGESDVDIGVVCSDTFFYDLPDNTLSTQFGITAASYSYAQYKDEVGEALTAYFGKDKVRRGNKAFDIRETSYHVEADVAPFFEYRRYNSFGSAIKGVELRPDNGLPPRVINWPEQHYANGVAKNTQTGTRFKSMVRVLKSLRNEMDDAKIAAASPAIGFLNECLVWNVPNQYFGNARYEDDLRSILDYLATATANDGGCGAWQEVSDLKYLFGPHQKWTRSQANAFILAARQHIGPRK